jgi:hypothetical protein
VDDSPGPDTSNREAVAKRRRLALAYLQRHREVEGWLEDTAARVTDHLLQAQGELGITGDVLEIGVHHGRYFIVLANGLAPAESAIAVDIFTDQHLNTSRSGAGNWSAFVTNVARFAPLARVEIVQANSTELGDEFVTARNGVRFVSIDGGHDRATTCSDLWLAERLATTGAIVALDDIYRPDWSGVTAGLATYLGAGGALHPFAFIPNKLLLTTDAAWAETYRESLRRGFADFCDPFRPALELFSFDDVLLIWNQPQR